MEQQPHTPIEELEFFKQFVEVADRVWKMVSCWPHLAVETIGKRLIRAIDRVGVTLVEGDARYSDAEAVHLFVIARGSARETRYWVDRSVVRELMSSEEAATVRLTNATRQLNGIIRYRRESARAKSVRESPAPYDMDQADPLTRH